MKCPDLNLAVICSIMALLVQLATHMDPSLATRLRPTTSIQHKR